MAVTRSFICCLLYWTAINGLGECGKNEITDAPNHDKDKGKKSGEFPPMQSSGYVTALRYDGRPPIYKYLYNTPGQPTEDLITYGSTMVISSPKVTASSRGQKGADNLQGSTYMKTYSGTASPTGSLRQSSAEKNSNKATKKSTRKKRVIDSQRMFRYGKQFSSLPHQETSANLSENPPTYTDEETGGNRKKKNKHGRGNRNRKQGGRKKTNVMETRQTLEEELLMVGSNKGGRMKGKSRKLKTATSRDGQSNRRRQHMQHKKKVKQFLQKRIQEQIAQRRHRRGTPA